MSGQWQQLGSQQSPPPYRNAHEDAVQLNMSSSFEWMTPLPAEMSRDEFLKYGLPLYQAALQGDWPAAEQILEERPPWMRQPIAKRGERVLHIAAAAKRTHFVTELVKLMEAQDLALRNEAENTALCLAATSGVVEIAKVMVHKNTELPNLRGSQEMSALQMAALLGHRNMVWYLDSVTDDSKLEDKDRIEILGSSIDTELFDFAKHMLDKHPHLALLRDKKGETALHALAQRPSRPGGYDKHSMWARLVSLGESIAYGSAQQQQQPLELHLVQSLWSEIIKQDDKIISNLIGTPWKLLFVAAQYGNVEFLITLIRSYPDLIWKVDEKGRSIFHIAIKNRHEEIFKLIHELGAIKDLIAIDTDKLNYNNMLHLAGALAPSHRLNCVSGAALQMQRELLWFKEVEKVVRPEYAEKVNKDNMTPRALFTKKHEELRTKGEEWMKKTAEACTLVATLIATVVFTAAFTLPGGVDSTGTPVFTKRPLFTVFVIFNAISLFSSSSSILLFLSIITSRYAEDDFLKSLPLKLMLGLTGLFVSIATMMVAFTVTFFMTFGEGIKWVPVPIALLASVPVALFALQQFSLLLDIYRSTYRSWSLFQPTKPRLFPTYSNQLKKKKN